MLDIGISNETLGGNRSIARESETSPTGDLYRFMYNVSCKLVG